MEPWRSKDQAAADEADELRHRQQLEEIIAPRRLDSGTKNRSESVQEGTLL